MTVRHSVLEAAFFKQLQHAVHTPEVIEYLVSKLLRAQKKKSVATDHGNRALELKAEIDRIVAAIAAVGHSDALVGNLKTRELELRELSATRPSQREFTTEEITAFVCTAVADIPKLMAKSPQTAKAELARHVEAVRMLPQADGTYIAEGRWDLLGDRGPVMVAGAGFEPATFGL